MSLAARARAAARALSLWVRRLRRDALGMNRRNVSFLVPYNPRPLFAFVDLTIFLNAEINAHLFRSTEIGI